MTTITTEKKSTEKKVSAKAPLKSMGVKAHQVEKKVLTLEAKIFDVKGKAKGTITLPSEIFGCPWNSDLVHQVVTSIQSNNTVPYAHTKDRSEVRGGGKKPWQQKGTGRARHGSNRSPLWAGGGVTFGPRNDKNTQRKINKKMRTKAVYAILSRKLKDGELIFIDNIHIKEPKTVEAREILSNLAKNGFEKLTTKPKNAALILLSEHDVATAKSFRNINNVYVEEVRNMNPLNLLSYKYVVITKPTEAIAFLESKRKKVTVKK